jgi:hypothetical protein
LSDREGQQSNKLKVIEQRNRTPHTKEKEKERTLVNRIKISPNPSKNFWPSMKVAKRVKTDRFGHVEPACTKFSLLHKQNSKSATHPSRLKPVSYVPISNRDLETLFCFSYSEMIHL